MNKLSIKMNEIKDFQQLANIAANSDYKTKFVSGNTEINAHSLLGIFTLDWDKAVDVVYDEQDTKMAEFLKNFIVED